MNIDLCRTCPNWRERIFVYDNRCSIITMMCLKCRCDSDVLQLNGSKHLAIVDAMDRSHVSSQFVRYGDRLFDDISHSVLEHFLMKEKFKEREVPRECDMYAEHKVEDWNR